jgi:DNA-directed RNA polymerase specialized sigma24 family protein
MATRPSGKHYIDNKLFYTVMLQYKNDVNHAKEHGLPNPPIPPYVGECLFKIATRLCMKPNFVNYTYRDEMVADGLENCVAYINNFDPEKSTNPFAYFTQIIYYAFLRRIEHEKKHLYIKQKTLENFYFEGMLAEQAVGEDDRVVTVDLDNEYMKNLVESYEKKQAEKQTKAREKKLGVEKFISDGE